ncbi:MAG: transcriptional regulator [Euryarchaeota archaeon]|nr:transcriptional regulator [Euryarchaeota archaeon]
MLHRNREESFNHIRDTLGLSDGNLGSHVKRLMDSGYVCQRYRLVGTRFEPCYALTNAGIKALMEYLDQLKELLPLDVENAGP